jgi:uncharacterized protein YndB with AHSA1/START domain
MSSVEDTTLRLRRSFQASPAEVFDAWTNPEVLRRWWVRDPAWSTPVADVDLRVGGGYRLTMEDPDTGHRHTVRGEYLTVNRPELLVYSWSWELDDGGIGPASTVTVEFLAEEEGTSVVLVHTGLEDPGSRDRHGQGWGECLDSLARAIFTGAAEPS